METYAEIGSICAEDVHRVGGLREDALGGITRPGRSTRGGEGLRVRSCGRRSRDQYWAEQRSEKRMEEGATTHSPTSCSGPG